MILAGRSKSLSLSRTIVQRALEMGITLSGHSCVDITEDVVEFADRFEFEGFALGKEI